MTIAPAERVETSLEEIAALDFEPEVPCEADPDKPRCKIRYEIWMARFGILLHSALHLPHEPIPYHVAIECFCDHCSQPITIRFEPLR